MYSTNLQVRDDRILGHTHTLFHLEASHDHMFVCVFVECLPLRWLSTEQQIINTLSSACLLFRYRIMSVFHKSDTHICVNETWQPYSNSNVLMLTRLLASQVSLNIKRVSDMEAKGQTDKAETAKAQVRCASVCACVCMCVCVCLLLDVVLSRVCLCLQIWCAYLPRGLKSVCRWVKTWNSKPELDLPRCLQTVCLFATFTLLHVLHFCVIFCMYAYMWCVVLVSLVREEAEAGRVELGAHGMCWCVYAYIHMLICVYVSVCLRTNRTQNVTWSVGAHIDTYTLAYQVAHAY